MAVDRSHPVFAKWHRYKIRRLFDLSDDEYERQSALGSDWDLEFAEVEAEAEAVRLARVIGTGR